MFLYSGKNERVTKKAIFRRRFCAFPGGDSMQMFRTTVSVNFVDW
jgi:hypothetical protein